MLKDAKPSYTPMREKCNAIDKLKAHVEWSNFVHPSLKNLENTEKEKQVPMDGRMYRKCLNKSNIY